MVIITLLVVFSTSYFSTGQNPVPEEEHTPAVVATPTPEPPADIIEPPGGFEDTPEETGEPEPPHEDKIISIRTAYPAIARAMDYYSSKFTAAAVSVVVYDAKQHEFNTFQYGHKDLSTHQPINMDTKFLTASISKFVTVISAMTLVDEGKLDIDADISDYLGFEVRNPHHPDVKITTRMLMQHTSSIIDPDIYWDIKGPISPETTKQMLESGEHFMEWRPGSQINYSPFLAYSVIALICENISGKMFDDFAREVLFAPLGIDAAFRPANLNDKENITVLYSPHQQVYRSVPDQLEIKIPDPDNPDDPDAEPPEPRTSDHELAGANLTISAIDYAKILIMIGNGGVVDDDTRVLSQESINEIYKTIREDDTSRLGLGTYILTNRSMPFKIAYTHSGAFMGVNTRFVHIFNKDINRGVVVLSTGARGEWLDGLHTLCTELSFIAWQVFDW